MPGRLSLFSSLRTLLLACSVLACGGPHAAPSPQPANAAANARSAADDTVVEAREALRKRDRQRLAAARAAVQAAQHPLASWVEYWELLNRLYEVRADEIEAFHARWPGSYLEDRLRNDWLLELGRRRDWAAIARDYPRFKMNDDREVTCWWLLTEHQAGRDVRDAARAAWFAQRELDDGCQTLAATLFEAKRLGADDVWRKARLAVEANRPAAAKVAVGLFDKLDAKELGEALDNPLHYLRRPAPSNRQRQELRLLALMRVAQNDADVAAGLLEDRRQHGFTPSQAAWGWAFTGRQAAFKLSTDAVAHYRRAWSLLPAAEAAQPGWSEETLVWGARAALRAPQARDRWTLVLKPIAAMAPSTLTDPAWAYWKARALAGTAREGGDGDPQRAEAKRALEELASPLHFYGQLAMEDLGQPLQLPASAAPTTPAERETTRATPGFVRSMHLATLGLRDEARREWNFTLRGLGDRELLAAARWACEVADWQLCINTSDRTRTEFDLASRYPMPYSNEIHQAATAAGLEPAFVFGLIRQETRFMATLRSHAGASGLMQLMPNTARWVAKKIGIDFNPARIEQLYEPALNLKLGTRYLKMVLDDLSGSMPLAAAAYNAGPGRPRRWREGPSLEAAAWAENVPFNETRDYVKKVLANSALYAALLTRQPAVLKARLGPPIGPRDSTTPVNGELP
ncbi:lytic transglycosylase domain-containing protein [Aquincola sp. S2]|uniref:Lytic transglycosylase domain-containing protein n=1 Tax=Pseudaquabacterium terrae TaxID=2732868 RepID=A0ABX2EDD8_9BURK|nr:lytic transglycosylase domain-containing protein [Aquabacterium terrae]NRF66719.1 lytic transglycosylase domain-containing protein [Aquabacterium terrae]